jgi:hypothetical protein
VAFFKILTESTFDKTKMTTMVVFAVVIVAVVMVIGDDD